MVVPPISTTIASDDAGEERGAADRVGRAAGEGQHREALGVGGVHQRAVVLRQIEARLDAAGVERAAEGVDNELREIAQAGVHDRRVLALQQADAADVARQREMNARQRLLRRCRGACVSHSVLTGLNTEVIATDADALGPDVVGDAEQFVLVERRNLAAVEFVAAVGEIVVIADRRLAGRRANRPSAAARRSPAGRAARPRSAPDRGAARPRW